MSEVNRQQTHIYNSCRAPVEVTWLSHISNQGGVEGEMFLLIIPVVYFLCHEHYSGLRLPRTDAINKTRLYSYN